MHGLHYAEYTQNNVNEMSIKKNVQLSILHISTHDILSFPFFFDKYNQMLDGWRKEWCKNWMKWTKQMVQVFSSSSFLEKIFFQFHFYIFLCFSVSFSLEDSHTFISVENQFMLQSLGCSASHLNIWTSVCHNINKLHIHSKFDSA